MTRINAGIPVEQLSGRHLIAEHREIKRVPNLVKYYIGYDLPEIPDTFRLGTGHVKFFYNKLGYLLKRYRELYQECLKRNYKVQNYENAWTGIPQEWMQNYEPSLEDIRIIRERIEERTNRKEVQI